MVSGDMHYSEISRWAPGDGAGAAAGAPPYPLYDVTSSGLTQTHPTAAANSRRVAGPEMRPNWGELAIDWGRRELTLAVHSPADAPGAAARTMSRTVPLAELEGPVDAAADAAADLNASSNAAALDNATYAFPSAKYDAHMLVTSLTT